MKKEVKNMEPYDFGKIEKKLAKYLDQPRFLHTMGVMYTSASLAMVHGCDLQISQAAGLLNDCSKSIPNKNILYMCCKQLIPD